MSVALGLKERYPLAIRNFTVGPRRGLTSATASDLPNLAAVAGPNGAGKSALLEALWQHRGSFLEPGSEALYVGPNRTWRAGPLSELATRSFTQDYEQILKSEIIPGFQFAAPGGFNFLSGQSRFGSNADDAQALVKTSIVRISNRSESYIAQEFRRQGGKIAPNSVADLLQPFRILVDTLLPHLRFLQIDTTDVNNVRVMFTAKDPTRGSQEFDIDDLSSGEKAAIALFLPFIERQVKTLLGESAPSGVPGVVPLTLLLDEPEIHLHPLLQLNVLEYMRGLARSGDAQFIFTTHSPTLLDALEPHELFLLSPASVSPDNQLSRLSASYEKLEVARAITGSTHVLTRGKPVVFIEGEPDVASKASDKRLISLLVPESAHWAIVPSHGKSQVIRAVTDMRAAHLSLPGLPVFGLVDGDQGENTGSDHVIAWPVAMVENLLLDPEAIRAVLSAYGNVNLRDAGQIETSLRQIASARVADEVRLRVQASLPSRTLRPSGDDSVAISASIDGAVEEFKNTLTALEVDKILEEAKQEVADIQSKGAELERFRGKPIIHEFIKKHRLSALTNLGINAFLTEVARHATESERTVRLTSPAIERIRLYFPNDLATALESAPQDDHTQKLLEQCKEERRLWQEGTPQSASREALRQQLLQLGRTLRSAGEEVGEEIMRLAASIGTAS